MNTKALQCLRYIGILIYVVELTTISWCLNHRSLIGIDDANIYMVYMRNFANGHGFVFNVGGERVEGFTSLLWTMVGALFYSISSSPELLLLLTNVVIVAYTLLRTINILEEGGGTEFFNSKSLLLLAIIGITPGFIDWTVLSLMESGLWCSLLTLTSIKIIEYESERSKVAHYGGLSVLSALLVLCRPESMLWVPVFILMNVAKECLLSHSIKSALKWAMIPSLFFACSLGALIFWRLSYFGYPLPNTYYAKMSSSGADNFISGALYVVSLLYEKPFIGVILVHSTFVVVKFTQKKEILGHVSLYMLLVVVGTTLFIPLCNGGDHFALHRFIMPSVPLFVLLWMLILDLSSYENGHKFWLIIVSICFSNCYNLRETWDCRVYPTSHEWKIAVDGRNSSYKLNAFFEDHTKLPSVGVWLAGGTAYSYKGVTIDLMGLNNSKMAHASGQRDRSLKGHAAFNTDVFFELSPDVLWYFNTKFVESDTPPETILRMDKHTWVGRIFKNIHLDEKFMENYGLFRISRPEQHESLQIFASKAFVRSLNRSKYKVINIAYE